MFDLKPLERILPHPIPKEYVQFMERVRLPRLRYLSGDDLASLFGCDARIIIEANENLRDTALNPYPWNESYFAIGERAEDEAIYYLDLKVKTQPTPLFVLEPHREQGVLVSPNVVHWIEQQLDEFIRADERCHAWHLGQYPIWWNRFLQLIRSQKRRIK